MAQGTQTDMVGMYSEEAVKQLHAGHDEGEPRRAELAERFTWRDYKVERSREYATTGFVRRLNTVARCISNVFRDVPPERVELLSLGESYDTAINLQAFLFNAYGCIDNLAWILVWEKGITKQNGRAISPSNVGLTSEEKNEAVLNGLSSEFREYLLSRADWFKYIEDFRHALAHRIPIYVPPFLVLGDKRKTWKKIGEAMSAAARRGDYAEHNRLSDERDLLGEFRPVMTHSPHEAEGTVGFHNQMLCDFLTVIEMGEKVLIELDCV